MALLDEVIVALTSDEISPLLIGLVYCAVIEICHEIFDLSRAQEWTASLSRWCDAHPDMVLYRGQCLVYRAEIMLLHGAWSDAMEETRRACERLAQPPERPEIGAALYQQAELHRLRGEFARAESAYREASQRGRNVQPGLALLRLAQGQTDRRARRFNVHWTRHTTGQHAWRFSPRVPKSRWNRATWNLLAWRQPNSYVLSAELDIPLLNAVAAQVTGTVLCAQGDATAALESLRSSWKIWQSLDVPYESARCRLHIGICCRMLGDEDTAQMEFDAARWVFNQLGAATQLAKTEALSRSGSRREASGLTPRELEVLRLVAAGKSNRAIAADLFLSEKTVARHVSNIFDKLDVSSRSAATAYAFEHRLQ